jgi:hypothetical protein
MGTHLDELIHVSCKIVNASAAVRYSMKQDDEMNASWNSVFRRIFGFRKYESVTGYILA